MSELEFAEDQPPRSLSPSSLGEEYELKRIPSSPGRSLASKTKRNCATMAQNPGPEKITFLVENSRVTVEASLLASRPDTMLGKMFSLSCVEGRLTRPNDDGDYTLKGVSLDVFRCILEYYKSGVMYCPPHVHIRDLREACDYLLLPFNERTVRCSDFCALLHELSNDGAKLLFESYLSEQILPVMVQCAKRGDRECHIVFLCEDDVVEWDTEYPPTTGEEYYEVIRSTKLYRFFKYVENRDVAKDVLRERSLKKIRFGIEGYPTHMEKLRRRPNSDRTEVVYNYVQRPFVHCGWEVEEARSRHVDFQCVKPKAGIAPDPEAAYLIAGEPATDQQEGD
ncbi:BTB/POZ domain-containing protein 10-like [Sycon ciliatum]|uniref:BTB/POZ domain-containing protein 10-like n=1 Tax=Sycon ciliatum TaxID=27933 RepID=UPI0020A89700|eukprot:scpid62741/ scgid34908/ BTB/POZ domain-containing protein KCTD20